MNKNSFYLKAIRDKSYNKKSWIISAFSVTMESMEEWKKNPYLNRIVRTPTAIYFVNQNRELEVIDDVDTSQPLFDFKQKLIVPANTIVNLKQDIETSFGTLLINAIWLSDCFGDKIPYINGKVSMGYIEDIISKRLKDTKDKNKIVNLDISNTHDNSIYVDEYIKFSDSVLYMTQFTQLCVQGDTEKTMTSPPGIQELKAKLLKQYKGQLSDPAIIAEIDKQLIEFAKQYLKGDPGEDFLLGNKAIEIIYKKLFLIHGGETGLSEQIGMDLIENSLEEGWQKEKFRTMNNSLRAGSYNRGAQTQLGGEAVKWLLRASANIRVTDKDCGSKLGKEVNVTKGNFKRLLGLSVIENDQPILVENEEQAGTYIGKTIYRRSPMYCKLDKTDYCQTCVGVKLAGSDTGLSLAVSDLGSTILYIYMSAMHGKALQVQDIDLEEIFF